VVGICTYTMVTSIPYLLRTPAPVGFGLNALETGLVMTPGALIVLLAGPLAGSLVNRWGGKPPLVFGALALLMGYVTLFLFNSTWLEIALDQILIGIGIGFSYSAMAAIIVHSLPREETGVGSAVYTVMRSLGNVIGPTVTAAFLLTYRAPLPIPIPSGVKMVSFPAPVAFDYIFLTTIAIALVGVVTSLLVRGDAAKLEHHAPAAAKTLSTQE
jgi:MFS family permease